MWSVEFVLVSVYIRIQYMVSQVSRSVEQELTSAQQYCSTPSCSRPVPSVNNHMSHGTAQATHINTSPSSHNAAILQPRKAGLGCNVHIYWDLLPNTSRRRVHLSPALHLPRPGTTSILQVRTNYCLLIVGWTTCIAPTWAP